VDLPPQRYIHLQLFSDLVHDGADVHHRAWPNPSEVFGLELFGKSIPLLLIAIMTFVLISSSGTMAMAVKFGYEKNRKMTFILLLCTAALGATFVGMQAFEWTSSSSMREYVPGVTPWARLSSARLFHGSRVSMALTCRSA